MKNKTKFLLVIAIASLIFSARLLSLVAEEGEGIIVELKLFSKALGAVLEGYVQPREPRKLLYSAINGMLGTLDPYSFLIDEEHYKLLKIDMKGEYSGIGAALEIVDKIPVISKIRPGSAAEEFGLKIQDKIMKVDGKSTQGKDVPEVASWLRGEENTTTLLLILRPPEKKPFEVKIQRKKVQIDAVNDVRIVGKAVGYFRIDNWQDHTAEQFDTAYKKLQKGGIKVLIIDLRGNGGGVMTSAIALAERFLAKGEKIIAVDSRIDVQKKDHFSSGDKLLVTIPTIILVNEKSASASEIFSAALQDHKKAMIVGMKTYGKASVQSVLPLDDVSAMKFTTARYMTPNGRFIDGVGIIPDYVVPYGPEGVPNADQQIRKALELFKEYM